MSRNTQTGSYPPLADSEQITSPKKVSEPLKCFTKLYTPLTVKTENHKQRYTSCIVSLEQDHQLLITEDALPARGKLDGVDIQFFTTLQCVAEKDNLLTYHMGLPKLLEYRQRRQTYRHASPSA